MQVERVAQHERKTVTERGRIQLSFDFRRDGAEQHGHRDNHPRLSSLRSEDYSFNTRERSVIDRHSLAASQIGPRHAATSRNALRLNRADLGLNDGDRSIAEADDLRHAGGIQDSDSLLQRKPAEQIAAHDHRGTCSVLTLSDQCRLTEHKRQERFKATLTQVFVGAMLATRFYANSEPVPAFSNYSILIDPKYERLQMYSML